tara:strand:+ start:519 stop:665 length:147 start_codon:yes stop_codon:yes gene_type:complete
MNMPSIIIDMPNQKPIDITEEIKAAKNEDAMKEVLKKAMKKQPTTRSK